MKRTFALILAAVVAAALFGWLVHGVLLAGARGRARRQHG